MKPLHLLVLSMFSLALVQAETPTLEEAFPSSLSSTPMLAENEVIPFSLVETDTSVEEELSVLDEEFQAFEQELSLDETASLQEPSSEASFIEVDITLPSVDLSEPVNSDEQALSVHIPEIKTEQVSMVAEEAVQDNAQLASVDGDVPSTLNIQTATEDTDLSLPDIQVDLARAFAGSPFIYSILLCMSVCSVFIWLYSILSLKKTTHIPSQLISTLHSKLEQQSF